ncbi:hypothetical protein FQZ97_895690 [compost metagenome]
MHGLRTGRPSLIPEPLGRKSAEQVLQLVQHPYLGPQGAKMPGEQVAKLHFDNDVFTERQSLKEIQNGFVPLCYVLSARGLVAVVP